MSRRKQERADRTAQRTRKRKSPRVDVEVAGPAREALQSARATMDARRPASPVRFERRPRLERPRALWHPIPVAELLVVVGLIGIIIGLGRGPSRGAVPLMAGIGLCTLAVLELTVREHFSGFRSHSLLLAFFPVVALETAVATISQSPTAARIALLPDALLYFLLFQYLRRRFHIARDRRMAPSP